MLQLLAGTCNKHDYQTAGLCMFLARSSSSLLLSCVLKILSLDAIDLLNGSYPSPDRHSGSALGPQTEGNILHVAVFCRAEGVVRVLLDVFKKNRLTLDHFDSIAETPLFLAVKAGNDRIASMLLEAAADVNTISGRAYLSKIGKEMDTDHYNAITPLSVACMQRHVSMARLLLQHGAEPNAGNGVDLVPSPLMAILCDSSNSDRQS